MFRLFRHNTAKVNRRRRCQLQIETLVVSPVKVRIGEFNRPVLGDRLWGVYNVFPDVYRNRFDAYVLRRDQNRPGGFTTGSGG